MGGQYGNESYRNNMEGWGLDSYDQWQALVFTVMNHQVLKDGGNFLSSLTTVSFPRKCLFHGLS
jgi:hypothetical protein